MPADSDLAQMARALDPKEEGNANSKRVGELLCERVMHCRGITRDGECWALGSQAVAEVIRQVTYEVTSRPEADQQ